MGNSRTGEGKRTRRENRVGGEGGKKAGPARKGCSVHVEMQKREKMKSIHQENSKKQGDKKVQPVDGASNQVLWNRFGVVNSIVGNHDHEGAFF